jgi:hypothetical protein
MQYIYEDHAVEGVVRMRDYQTVELADGNLRLGSDQHVDAFEGQIRTQGLQQAVERAVPASDVENASVHGKQTLEVLRQDTYAAVESMGFVEPLREIHRRPIPRMLTKKPESMV